MNKIKINFKDFLPACLILFFGGTIYVFFRSDKIYFIEWLLSLKIGPFLNDARTITLVYSNYLPHWFLFSLPDALWMLSLALLVLNFWKNESYQILITWVILILFIALLLEFAQYFNLMKGTFDWTDIFCYFIATILILFKLKSK